MNKHLFIETINKLKKQNAVDKKCSTAFNTILSNDFITGYDNSILTEQLVKILKIEMGDDHQDSWIDYWLWELDFGKCYKPGCVTEKDGTHIDISTPKKLWKFLIKNQK